MGPENLRNIFTQEVTQEWTVGYIGSRGYVTDQALDYLDQFDQSKVFDQSQSVHNQEKWLRP